MSGRPSICLSMIVRDEAHIVTEALDSVAPYIDHWVVVDTGSTDGTPDVVRDHMAKLGIPGRLHERPWVDFGHNRTEALQLCAGLADYAWVFDADDVIVGAPDFTGLKADSYLLRFGENFRYWRKQLFRDGLRWRYVGVVHEYATCDDLCTESRLDGDYHVDSRRLGGRNLNPRKYERDRDLLRAEVERHPDEPRWTFYLAQSCFDAGDVEEALHWYTRRSEMQGWDEETFCALLRRAQCLQRLDRPWPEVEHAHLQAWERRPTRAEPLHAVAHHHRVAGNFHLGHLFAERAASIPYPEGDNLFVAADVHRWQARDEQAICAFYIGRHDEAVALCRGLLDSEDLPESARERVSANRDFSVPALLEQTAGYPADVVAGIRPTGDPEVTLTITTCRRPALFEKTINSFLRCCTDLDRIGRWICVDNGSSEEDLAWMQKQYPFFELVRVDPAVGGHADALNELLARVDSPYWLHLEDDWHFFAPDSYVTRAIEILDDDDEVAQVALNLNYAELPEQRTIVGGEVRRPPSGRRYRRHQYLPNDGDEWRAHLDGLEPGQRTNAHWPHFTLRPSVMRTAPVRALGSFHAETGFFEYDFALRFTRAGLRTAFFDEVVCVHTGKDRSAYALVGDGSHQAEPDRFEVVVVNLDRRPDRMAAFLNGLSDRGGPRLAQRCRRVSAVDGRDLVMTDELRHLFRNNDFGDRRGYVGSALSHLAVWRQVAAASTPACLVFEDDATVTEGFADAVRETLQAADAEEWDVVLLGYLPWDHAQPDGGGTPRMQPMRWDRFLGGLFAYLVSREGARRLVDLVERDGIQQGIDWFLMGKQDELRVLEVFPHLARAPLANGDPGIDSDIQHDWQSVVLPKPPRLAEVAPSVVLAELRLDLPQGWVPRDAVIRAGGGGLEVHVVGTDPEPGRLRVRLDDELAVVTVEQDEGAAPAPGEGAEVPGGSLSVVTDDARHRLVLRGASGDTASAPFVLTALGRDERCGGLVVHDDEVLISFVVEDGPVGLAALELDQALGLLEPCP